MTELEQVYRHVRLQFEVNHPELENCWSDGYEFATSGREESANPYSEGTSEHEQWSQGWWAGFYGEMPLYDTDAQTDALTQFIAEKLNEPKPVAWWTPQVKKWAIYTLEIISVIALMICVIELFELPVLATVLAD